MAQIVPESAQCAFVRHFADLVAANSASKMDHRFKVLELRLKNGDRVASHWEN